jgi:acetoacetyl-CoA reductase/3-oxoacyl-[acyl-carrier protein] reductase
MAASPKLALVTGAGSGIGKATALALLAAGYQVACGYNGNRKGAETIRHPNAKAIQIDIASRASIRQALAETRKAFRRDVDILVNNAALVQEKPFDTLTDGDWDQMLAVNLRGAFILAQESLPAMARKKWGRIVNITSIGGQWGGMRQVHYAAAKAGLINLTHSLARLYSPLGITANAVSPGLVATDMIAKELNSKAGKAKAAQIPVGRIAQPDEIAAGVVFLASHGAAYITGQTLNINGGMLMS